MKFYIKGLLLGVRQFLTAESPLKLIKKSFLFHVKSSFLGFLSVCPHFLVTYERLVEKVKVNFKIYDITDG